MSAAKTLFTAIAAITLGFSTAAAARNGDIFTVKVEGAAAQSRVIAYNTVWNCEGDTCVARPDHSASVRSCRRFVRESGARVIQYGSEADQLTPAELARCNGEPAPTQQASN